MLDPKHAQHIERNVDHVRGLVLALIAMDERAKDQPIDGKISEALPEAALRGLECISALVEGYTEPPDLRPQS